MDTIRRIKVDPAKVKTAIEAGVPVVITTYKLPREMEQYMDEMLRTFFHELHQDERSEGLAYCLKELINNAKKANTKRIYFKEKNLNIDNPTQYEEGMASFKIDTITNIEHYLELQKEQGLYITLSLHALNDYIEMSVANRAVLTVFEYKRMHDKITRAQTYNSVDENFSKLLDDTEGAGLGLIIMMLVLRRCGFDDDNCEIISKNGETMVRLRLPFQREFKDGLKKFYDDIVDDAEALPYRAESISEIKQLLDDRAPLSKIAGCISKDMTFVANMLRFASDSNEKNTELLALIKSYGRQGLKDLVTKISSNTDKQLAPGSSQEILWKQCNESAFYAYNLATHFLYLPAEQHALNLSYLCGLLQGMGQIYFSLLSQEKRDEYHQNCLSRGTSEEEYEKYLAFMEFDELRARLGKKWGFPDDVIDVIRNTQEPSGAPAKLRRITDIIYLARLLPLMAENKITIEQLDSGVLMELGITSEAKIIGIANKLKKSFESA